MRARYVELIVVGVSCCCVDEGDDEGDDVEETGEGV